MIATRNFLDTGPDSGHVYVGDPDAHLFPPARPAPVMPPACVPGLPDAVVAILLEAHKRHISMGLYSHREATAPKYAISGSAEHYRKGALENAAKATAIVHALRDAAHYSDADALRGKAAALEEALHAVPAELEERMDLMDAAIPGGWL